jgi:hypothetical protein
MIATVVSIVWATSAAAAQTFSAWQHRVDKVMFELPQVVSLTLYDPEVCTRDRDHGEKWRRSARSPC